MKIFKIYFIIVCAYLFVSANAFAVGVNADMVDGMHASDLAPAVHAHSQSQVTGLDSALAGKADTVHAHSQSQVTGLEAALAGKSDVTHNHDGLYQQKYGKVAVVAQTGGDYSGLYDATANLGAWCGTPSPTNPCLIKIMPGIYDHQGRGVLVPDYVDIEGSGEYVTKIVNTTLFIYYNSEVRSLTIENSNGYNFVGIWTAIRGYIPNGGPDKITNVTINISNFTNASTTAAGLVLDRTIEYTLKDVTINISSSVTSPAYGILSVWSTGKMTGVTVNAPSALAGIIMQSSTSTIDRSSVSAAQTIVADGYSTAKVGHTNIIGAAPIGTNGGIVRCFGLFDSNYDPVACQ